jgi:transcriptional regulator with AAA-type ATPase domain
VKCYARGRVTPSRSFWPAALSIGYVGIAAAELGRRSLPWMVALAMIAILFVVYRRTERGISSERKLAGKVVRAVVWALALWLTARVGPSGSAALDAAANAGVGTAAVTSLFALARIEGTQGMLRPPRAAESLDAAMLAGFLWAIATALPLTYALLPSYRVRLDPLAIDYATTSAGAATLMLLIAAAFRVRVLRRLELGVGDRVLGALSLSITAFLVAVPASLFEVAAPDRILPVAVGIAAALSTWASTIAEPTTVSSALRGILAVMILGTPVTLSAGLAARAQPDHAGAIVLGSSMLAIVVGLLARAVARPLGPEQSRWLTAIDRACQDSLEPEPDAALRATLHALSGVTEGRVARPEIWRSHPEEVLSVDIAGYLHIEPGQMPPRIYEIALTEPERTLRAEVLSHVMVRRPEVRGLFAWFEARDAFSATVVTDDDGPVGFILLPRVGRTAIMTLEEARAVRVLADRISALLSVTSALARARDREIEATARREYLEGDRERLTHALESRAERQRVLADRIARRVRGAAYAPASRGALEELERSAKSDRVVFLRTPPGVDPAPWAAHAHLSSARSGGPFIVSEGTLPAEQRLEHWEDPDASPFRLADGGTLLVTDLAVLPLSVQERLARELSESQARAASALAPFGLFLSGHENAGELVQRGLLSPALQREITRELELPSLASRSEDLRALLLEAFSRQSPKFGKAPLGVDPSALKLLLEHSWPGNDLELEATVLRLSAIAEGKAVTALDLERLGFEAEDAAEPTLSPLPPASRRRAPRRFARGR